MKAKGRLFRQPFFIIGKPLVITFFSLFILSDVSSESAV